MQCRERSSETDQTPSSLQPAIRTRTSSPTCGWTACEPISFLGLTFLALALLTTNLSSPLVRPAVTRLSPSSANQRDRDSDSFRARVFRCACLHFAFLKSITYGFHIPRSRFSLMSCSSLGSRYLRTDRKDWWTMMTVEPVFQYAVPLLRSPRKMQR